MRPSATAQHIPPAIHKIAAEHQLSTPQIVYEPEPATALYRISGPCGMIIGCILIGVFFILYRDIFSQWPQWQAIIIPLVGVCWLCLGGWITYSTVIAPKVHVFVCPGGLIYVKRKVEVIPWKQIRRFWKDCKTDEETHISHKYTLLRSDDTTFIFTDALANVESLGCHIEEMTTKRLLPRAITAYNASGALDFAEITISARGIRANREGKMLSWSEVENVKVDDMTISIYKKGADREWSTIKVSDTPNVAVLKGMVDYARREADHGEFPQLVAYKAGLPVSFGKLCISQQGVDIGDGKGILSWSEIASIGVGESEVIIRQGGASYKWHVLPIWMVSDAPVLKELLEHVMSEE